MADEDRPGAGAGAHRPDREVGVWPILGIRTRNGVLKSRVVRVHRSGIATSLYYFEEVPLRRRLLLPSLFLILATGALFAQPRIARLVNSASYIPPPLPGSGIAQGSIFIVSGTGLGPANLVQNSAYPVPDTLAGVSVRVSGGGQELNCPMVYASATQTAAILPSRTPLGNALVRVTVNGQTSEPIALTVVRNGIGLYTLNSAGFGPAVLTDANFGVITRTNAANPGQTVIAWATGVGAGNVPDNEPPPAFDPPVTVEVLVGGRLANVRYRGRAPGFAGLDQIVFDIPEGVRGCNVSLVMRAGTNTSNFTTIPVAAGRVCSDPNGFSEQDLSNIPEGGLRIGSLSLLRGVVRLTVPVLGTIESISDTGGAGFFRIDLNAITRSSTAGANPGSAISFGSCTVTTFVGEGQAGDPIPITGLDAGPSLTVTGPGGARTLTPQGTGVYSAQLGSGTTSGTPLPGGGGSPPYLSPGDYTITGPGGRDIGAFTARIRLPAALNWTNQDAVTRINRGQDLTLTWSGGNPASDFIYIIGNSSRRNPTAGASFICSAPASAGSFTVPGIVTNALPPSESVQGAATGSLVIANVPLPDTARFTASGLDIGIIQYGTTIAKTLPIE